MSLERALRIFAALAFPTYKTKSEPFPCKQCSGATLSAWLSHPVSNECLLKAAATSQSPVVRTLFLDRRLAGPDPIRRRAALCNTASSNPSAAGWRLTDETQRYTRFFPSSTGRLPPAPFLQGLAREACAEDWPSTGPSRSAENGEGKWYRTSQLWRGIDYLPVNFAPNANDMAHTRNEY
jgi:hypothetical protein